MEKTKVLSHLSYHIYIYNVYILISYHVYTSEPLGILIFEILPLHLFLGDKLYHFGLQLSGVLELIVAPGITELACGVRGFSGAEPSWASTANGKRISNLGG